MYLLRCGDGSLYAGATNGLARRVRQHLAGRGARYTRSRLPVELVWWERARDRSSALRREAALKRLTRAEKLELVQLRSLAEGAVGVSPRIPSRSGPARLGATSPPTGPTRRGRGRR